LLRNLTRAAGLATAALLIPGAALADPGHGHGNGHGNPHGGPAFEQPATTDDTTTAPTTDTTPDDTTTTDAPVAHGHGKPADAPAGHGKHLAKGHAKPHKLVLKGTVVSIGAAAAPATDPADPTATTADTTGTDTTGTDTPPAVDPATTVTIHVTRANHHGRALVGQDVTFTIPAGGVRAADTNGDGKVDLSDVKVGDKVLVQTGKVSADATQPLPARKLVDQSSKKTDSSDDSDAEDAPAPTTDPAPVTDPAPTT
jgi:hypothetical protein